MNYNNERGVRNNNIQPVGGPSYGESPASGPAPTTAGHHKHDILNKLDPRVDSTKDSRPIASQHGGNNVPEGTYGPHSSRLANALDPRVDSDLDGKGARTANAASGGPTMHGAGTGAGMGMGGGMGMNHRGNNNNNIPEGTYGPHSSRMANAVDPRVDSDADRSRMAPGGMGHTGMGNTHTHSGAGAYGSATGVGGAYGSSGPGPAPKTAGPHKSDLLNKLDPRVDSKTGAVSGSYGGAGANTHTGAGARY
ncbi:hypothetical protein V8F20_006059 [Naviculisporaceae sp. PSN 640]